MHGYGGLAEVQRRPLTESRRWRRHNTSGKLEDHIRLIRQEIQTSIDDPATRVLAAAQVSGNFDNALDRRSGIEVPVIPYYGRYYRAVVDWNHARKLCAMRDYACEVDAIWNLIVLNIRYTQDQDAEDTYCTVRATFEMGAGDCDDGCICFASLLKAVGFENVIARVVSVHGNTWDHIYPLVMLPTSKRWLALDFTEEGHHPGWEYRNVAAKRDFAL